MKKICFCGGGTLGHFTPNIAIFESIQKDYECFYIGSKNGIEKQPAENLMPYYSVETVKFERSFTLKNLLIPFKLLKGISDAKKILKAQKPDVIFSKGGFVSVPVVIAGKKLGIPCITHESDYTLGLANKIIAKKCIYVCTSFESTAKTIKNGVYTGAPIRKQIFNGNKNKINLKINPNKKTILIIGGSLGAENLNNAVRQNLSKLNCYNIIHITGKGKLNQKIKSDNYFQVEFAQHVEDYFSLSDMVITRGGSNTIFELLAIKKPMVIVPLSTGRGDQILNAKEFNKLGYSEILLEENLTSDALLQSILSLSNKSSFYKNNMQKYHKNGTEEIIKLINSCLLKK